MSRIPEMPLLYSAVGVIARSDDPPPSVDVARGIVFPSESAPRHFHMGFDGRGGTNFGAGLQSYRSRSKRTYELTSSIVRRASSTARWRASVSHIAFDSDGLCRARDSWSSGILWCRQNPMRAISRPTARPAQRSPFHPTVPGDRHAQASSHDNFCQTHTGDLSAFESSRINFVPHLDIAQVSVDLARLILEGVSPHTERTPGVSEACGSDGSADRSAPPQGPTRLPSSEAGQNYMSRTMASKTEVHLQGC